MKRTVGDQVDAAIDQLFFNNPDGFMVEICNCENLELKPRGDRHAPSVAIPGRLDRADAKRLPQTHS
ncbi:unnamed protein product [Brassica oleracea]|uniref:Uncharacterized protein n=1 Tax=Brassica oleracea TaxID=3712 RepID=A0A3P6CH05_BRAOL|nr:unnamed protein product [Brassica oleracea]